MNDKRLQQNIAAKTSLTTPASLDRLFEMMRNWWEELTLTDIATKHSVSKQRVGKLLATVSCTREWSRKARRDLADSRRRERAELADEARQMLLHPFAWKLTPRQRGALAWRAQGLTLLSIGHRMGCSTQGVFSLLWDGRERLARLEYRYQQQANPIDTSEWEMLLTEQVLPQNETDGHA